MLTNRIRLLIALPGALLLSWTLVPQASADAPGLMTYQGRLKESGVPVTGARAVTIQICNALTGGTCNSTGSQQVSVTNGLFMTTFTSAGWDPTAGPYYLEVDVAGTPLTPREQLTSSPYAVYATSAATLIANTGSAGVSISTNLFVGNGGSVGIGTSSPGQALVVVGTATASSSINSPQFTSSAAGQPLLVESMPNLSGTSGALNLISGPNQASGGAINIIAANAGNGVNSGWAGGQGGGILLQAGAPVPSGGSGYGNLGSAGNVVVNGGNGYNNAGGNVMLAGGATSSWGSASTFSYVSVQGGPVSASGADVASLNVEGGHNAVQSGNGYALGGNIRLTAGSGVGSGGVGTGYAGGSVILTPGVGSTNGHIEIAGGSVGSHLRSTQATAPTIADNGNCATTTLTAAGTDMAGSIVFAAGSGATVPCVLTLTFNSPYAAAPKAVILTPGNQSAAAKMIETYAAATTSNFTITFFGAAVTNGFTYSLYYLIIE